MTTSIIFWTTVAIIALFCLLWLFWQDASPAPERKQQSARIPTAMDELARRVNESEAANETVSRYMLTLADGRITGVNIAGGQFNAQPATEDDIVAAARVGIMVKAEDWARNPTPEGQPAPVLSSPRKPEYRYRSAKTGRFVKASYAKRYPHRTVRSKVKS